MGLGGSMLKYLLTCGIFMEKKAIISTISIILFIMVTGTAFGQISDLVLHQSDIRFEYAS